MEYPVYFSIPGRYYVWVRGWGPDSADDTIHAGLDGQVPAAADRIGGFDDSWGWSRRTRDGVDAYLDINETGFHLFNLFMSEDGFKVDKVILTTDDAFTPSGTGPAESFCCEPLPPPPTPGLPPGHRDCSQVLLQGSFEGDIEVADGGYWHLGEEGDAARQSSNYRHSGNFSLALRAFTQPWPPVVFHPWAYQRVALPADLAADAELSLTLYYLVERRSTPREEDVLYVKLRNIAGTDMTSDMAIANGASTDSTWTYYSLDVGDSLGDVASYGGQDVQLYFHAPNDDGNGTTGFYIDDARLDVCVTEPIPEINPDLATIGGSLRVWIEGKLSEMVGVTVWAYRTDGGECRPGENVCVTSSIHDSTYHFYNIEPGEYVIYSEVVVGTQLKIDSAAVTIGQGEVRDNVNLAL
jgi:hypothetical protein